MTVHDRDKILNGDLFFGTGEYMFNCILYIAVHVLLFFTFVVVYFSVAAVFPPNISLPRVCSSVWPATLVQRMWAWQATKAFPRPLVPGS